jgi:hypothetical protein
MPSSGMLRRVALVRTDFSEEICSSETSVLTRATWRHILEDVIPQSSLMWFFDYAVYRDSIMSIIECLINFQPLKN